MDNLQRALEEQKQQTAPDVQQIPGLLGIPLNGQRRVEVAGRNAYVYVRLRANQNEVMQAYNNQVAPAYNLPVLLERQGNKYVVIGVDTARYENNWTSQSPFLARHGNTHSFDLESGGGGDIVWVQSRQIVPALVFPSGSAGADSVIVNPYVLRNNAGEWKYVGNTGTVSFSPYRPTGSNALMLLIYLDSETGNPGFVVNSGSVFSNTLTGTSQIIPYIPALPNQVTQIPLAAIRLITGTSQISWDNIYDVRQWLHPMASGSAGGISSVSVQDEGSPQGTATTFNFVGDGVQATISGSVARVSVSAGAINTGTLDARYLKLDTSNDPLIGNLLITGSLSMTTPSDSSDISINVFSKKDGTILALEEQYQGSSVIALETLSFLRYPISTAAPIVTAPYLRLYEEKGSGSIHGQIIKNDLDGTDLISAHPHATGTIANYIWSTDKTRPTGTVHTSFRVNNSEVARVDVSGTVYSNGSPLIKEAPVDSQMYARKNAGWTKDILWLPFTVYGVLPSAMSAGNAVFIAAVDRTVTLINWAQACRVDGTNDGSNYWVIQILRLSDSSVVNEINTSAISANAWSLITDSSWSISSVGTADIGVYVNTSKTGAPGTLSMGQPLVEISI